MKKITCTLLITLFFTIPLSHANDAKKKGGSGMTAEAMSAKCKIFLKTGEESEDGLVCRIGITGFLSGYNYGVINGTGNTLKYPKVRQNFNEGQIMGLYTDILAKNSNERAERNWKDVIAGYVKHVDQNPDCKNKPYEHVLKEYIATKKDKTR